MFFFNEFRFSLEKINPPPAAEATKIRNSKPTAFRKFYERGDFPIALEHDTKGNKIAWKVRKPIFFNFRRRNNFLFLNLRLKSRSSIITITYRCSSTVFAKSIIPTIFLLDKEFTTCSNTAETKFFPSFLS